jgi:hypothetical protein
VLLWDGRGLGDLGDGRRHDGLDSWCAANSGAAAVLWVAGPVLVDLVPDAETAHALHGCQTRLDWARRVLQHYRGAEAQRWPMSCWRCAGGAGVGALPAGLLQGWQAAAQAHGVRLRGVHALWPLALRALLRRRKDLRRADSAWAAWADGDTLTIWALQRGRPTAVHRRRLAPATTPVMALALLRERVAEAGAVAMGPVALLWSGDAPPDPAVRQAHPELLWLGGGAAGLVHAAPPLARHVDFLRTSPRPAAAAWVAAGAALATLAVVAVDAGQAWSGLEAARAIAQPAPAAAGTHRARAGQAPGPDRAPPIERLAHPWPEVFGASEVASGRGLSWLALEHAIGGELRLVGLADSEARVQRVAASLRARPSWRDVLVARLERGDGASGQPGMRFELVAQPAQPEARSAARPLLVGSLR